MSERVEARARPRRALATAALVAFAGFVAFTFVALSARAWWVGELATNWRWQAGWAGLAVVLALALARHRVLALACLALVGWHLAPALRLFLGTPEPVEGPVLRVATANVLWRVGKDDALRAWLERERFDLVALQELDRDRLPLLDALRASYPHQLRWPVEAKQWNPGTWGQALLSRHPMDRAGIVDGGWEGQPVLEARVRWNGRELLLVGAHPMRPGRARRIAARAAALEAIAELVRDEPLAIVMGDLNSTVYSPAFADLLADGRLNDSRQGFGRQGSFAPNYPIAGRVVRFPFRLDLDHVLVGNGIAVLDRRLGPDLGSDHTPVEAVLAPRR